MVGWQQAPILSLPTGAARSGHTAGAGCYPRAGITVSERWQAGLGTLCCSGSDGKIPREAGEECGLRLPAGRHGESPDRSLQGWRKTRDAVNAL